MPSFRTVISVVTTAFVGTAWADYYIEPSSVALSTRENWCQSEIATCPLICEDMGVSGASVNTCNATTLSYGCLCVDGQKPNVTQYSLTLPYFVCTEWGIQCQDDCGSNSTCAAACTQEHPCGAQDPSPPNSTNSTASATSGSATSTSGGDTIYTSLSGDKSGAPAFEMARLYSTMGVLGLFSVGFAYLL